MCDTYQNTRSIEHRRARHVSFIKRPRRFDQADTHSHYWYCFECGSELRDHGTYDSNDHLKSIYSYAIHNLSDLSQT
ncbi:unnamed protein product [Fusarium fujikuroi]|nr:unnamed protein product [Fusarium fujikuroi]